MSVCIVYCSAVHPKKEEIIEILTKAKTAHTNWLALLKQIVDEGKEQPIQANPKKES